jgi:ABC-type glutathione transport system ATPase component
VHVDPDILLIDEVLSVGDEEFSAKCVAKIQEMKYRGVTLIFVTHQLDQVRKLCDRALWLDHGQAAQIGDPVRVVDSYLQQVATGGVASGFSPATLAEDAEDAEDAGLKSAAAEEPEVAAKPLAEQKKQRKREEAERRNRLSPLRAEVARCEARITELERRRQEIEAQLASPDLYGEQSKHQLQELLKTQTQLRRDLNASEEAWLAATERLDAELAADQN